MGSVFFMRPVLTAVSQGKFFSRFISAILRIVGVIVAIAGLVSWFGAWALIFKFPFIAVIGGIIFQVAYAIAIYMVVHTLFIRATDIATLPEADYNVIPIIAVFFKLLGELFASFVVPITIGAGVMLWFAGGIAYQLFGSFMRHVPLPAGGIFLSGLLMMIVGAIIAFLVMMYFYCLAEFTIVFVDIARNTRATMKVAKQYDKSAGGNP